MSNNLLVVATDVTGINNIIQNKINGLLYTKGDFDSLKCSLEFAIKNKLECRKLTEYARVITLKDFDYKKNILDHIKLYEKA